MATKKGTSPKKPAQKAAPTKSAKKATAKKPAKKAAPKKSAEKAAVKEAVRKTSPKKSAEKATAKKPAKKAAPKESAKKVAVKDRGADATPTAGKAERTKSRTTPKKGETRHYRPKAQMGPEGILILPEDKFLYQAYYGGQQIPSPMSGGFLMLLGVRPHQGDGAVALFECSASSLRCQLAIPKATRTERSKVKAVQEAGDDPECPRHGLGHRLVRTGKELTCRLCGISYGRV